MWLCSSYVGLWGSVSCNGVIQCWLAQRGQAIVPRSSPYMVHEKWIQACAQTFQTFQSFMTIQPFQAVLQILVSPGNPPHSSILQSECIFYIFYKFYSSIGFHRKLHRVPVEQYKLQTFCKHYILQRKGDVVISVKHVLVKMSR